MALRDSSTGPKMEPNRGPAGNGVLEEIARSEDLPSTILPQDALAAVMCGLELALGEEGAQRLERELPTSIRKLVSGCSLHTQQEVARPANMQEFLERVGQHLDLDESEAEEVTRMVFHAVHRLMSVREVQDVARELPQDMRTIWTAGDDQGASISGSRLV